MKKKNIFNYLQSRGYIAQTIYPEELKNLLNNQKINFYIGFDPTADSLHIGHFLMLQVAKILQNVGHKPFLVIGGGTAHIGDPSGRTDMRKMLDTNTIELFQEKFKQQISKFLSFSGENSAVFLNNADWLLSLKWIEFMRQIASYISVNKMLSTDAYKSRWENGLSFLELNYMVMQGYDFLYLNRNKNVCLQIGGSDQWSNIIFGVDLIRRLEKKIAFGLTIPLLTKQDGTKMGKTASGALWMDEEKTSSYEFYQYWINVDDNEVKKLFLLLTDLTDKEINELTNKKGKEMISVKQRLAYEITAKIHGKQKALEAQKLSFAAFVTKDVQNMPSCNVSLSPDKTLATLLVSIKIAKSKTEARRLIISNSISINNKKITDPFYVIPDSFIKEKSFVIYKGKKHCIRIILK